MSDSNGQRGWMGYDEHDGRPVGVDPRQLSSVTSVLLLYRTRAALAKNGARTIRKRTIMFRGLLLGAAAVALLAGCGSTPTASTGNQSPATTAAPATTAPATTLAPATTVPPATTVGNTPMSAPPGTASAVPNVAGEELDQAEATLLSDNLGYKVFGGGMFGVVIASDWTVCSQTPGAGTNANAVHLVVARACS